MNAILHGGDVAWANTEESMYTPIHQVTGNDMITFITDVLYILGGGCILNYSLPCLFYFLLLGRCWRESATVGASVSEWGASGCSKH